MKRIIYPILLTLVLLSVLPFQTFAANEKKRSAINAIQGAWQIVEVDGIAVRTGENLLFLNFDCLKKAVNGFSGCNFIHGKFEFKAIKRHLRFLPIASSRMTCPDGETEANVLRLLSQVSTYTTGAEQTLLLLDENGKSLFKLSKMQPIDGKWTVCKVNDSILENMENEVYLVFNSAQETVYGSIGCNSYHAPLACDSKKPAVIKIGVGITTMMMCPDMSVEKQMLQALGSVVSYKKFSNRKAILCDSGGKILMELTR